MGIFLSMTLDDETDDRVGDMLRRHYGRNVSPEVAARHTMAIHREAARLRIEQRRSLRSARRPRRAVVASLVGAMVVGSSTGALAASEETLPGHPLYPVKRISEQAGVIAAATVGRDGDVGRVYVDIARMRVHEAQIAAPIRPPEVVERLKDAAVAALEAAERKGAPNVAAVGAELLADADRAVEVSEATEVAALQSTPTPAAPGSPSGSLSASPSPSAASPSASPSVSPSVTASPAPSPSVPAVVASPGEDESGTVDVPTPSPSPSPAR